MKPRPLHVLVRGLIHVDGQFLLSRKAGVSYCHLPGGHWEPGESLLSALKRELREELGLRCAVGRFLGAVEHSWKPRGISRHEINLVFETTLPSLSPPEPPPSKERDLEFVWSTPADLSRYDLRPALLIPFVQAWSSGDRSTWWSTSLKG